MEPESLPLVASQLHRPAPGVFRWEFHSPAHKVELTAHAFLLGEELYVFDPIPLDERLVLELLEHGRPKAIVLTNANHWRDTEWWRNRLGVEAWAMAEAAEEMGEGVRPLPKLESWLGWEIVPLPGGACGETAFLHDSFAVLGDAVVNLPGRSLEILPEKYCNDNALLRCSLAVLAERQFESLYTAHGSPVLRDATAQIVALL